MEDKILTLTRKEFSDVFEGFQNEISKINIGRASVNLVEDLPVKYYGTTTPLKKIAQISTPDVKTIVVQPWDKTALSDIENAISNSEVNLRGTNDGMKIIISLPPLTEERRSELTKVVKSKEEEIRISLRNIRQKTWENIQQKQKLGEYTEDDKYRFEEELNKLIDEFNKKVDELSQTKSAEIMKI